MKKIVALITVLAMLLMMTACSVPVIRDLVGSENSLGKTNNTAVTIATARKDFLKSKNKEELVLYGMEMILNSDSNGAVLLYYSAALPEDASYSDLYVAEVDSKTGHVERFSKANYTQDGIAPYEMVKNGYAIQADALPIDSGKAISNGTKVFSGNLDFHYDYIEVTLTAPNGLERYDIEFISMLNDTVFYCTVDGVNGAVMASSTNVLE